MIFHQDSTKSGMIEQQHTVDVTSEKHSLYLRFAKKLNADRALAESEVKSLNSKIIRVRIPRQKSANFCLVDFASKEDQDKAERQLKKVEINDRRLVVKQATRNDTLSMRKKIEKIKVKREVNEALGKLVGDIKNSLAKNYAQRNVTNGVIVRHLKSGITQNDIRGIFPQAIDIKLNVKADRKNSFALIWLPTPKDAREAASETIQISGEEYVVSLENEGKRKRRKRVNDSNDSDADSFEEASDSEDQTEGSDEDDGSDNVDGSD